MASREPRGGSQSSGSACKGRKITVFFLSFFLSFCLDTTGYYNVAFFSPCCLDIGVLYCIPELCIYYTFRVAEKFS